jgi:hypothetical protein
MQKGPEIFTNNVIFCPFTNKCFLFWRLQKTLKPFILGFWERFKIWAVLARKLYYRLYKALDTLYNRPNSFYNTNNDTTIYIISKYIVVLA